MCLPSALWASSAVRYQMTPSRGHGESGGASHRSSPNLRKSPQVAGVTILHVQTLATGQAAG